MKKLLLGISIIIVVAINAISNLNYSQGAITLDFFTTNAMALGEYPDCGPNNTTDQYNAYGWASGRGWRTLKTYKVWSNAGGNIKVIADSQGEAQAQTGYFMYLDYSFSAFTYECDNSSSTCCETITPRLDMYIH